MGHKQWPSQCCYPIDVQIGRRSLYRIVYTCLALRLGWNADLDFIHQIFQYETLGPGATGRQGYHYNSCDFLL